MRLWLLRPRAWAYLSQVGLRNREDRDLDGLADRRALLPASAWWIAMPPPSSPSHLGVSVPEPGQGARF